MRLIACFSALMMTACTPVTTSRIAVPDAARLAQIDVENAVTKRFGTAALARARLADEFIAVLRYPGLPMPDHDTDGHPIKPTFPTGLLFKENGKWFAHGINGLHPILPRWSQRLEAALQNPALWAEPVTGGVIGCTDAGASYAWLRVAGHREQARIGHCGGSPLTEELVSAALMG
jgi:hypothetical protein